MVHATYELASSNHLIILVRKHLNILRANNKIYKKLELVVVSEFINIRISNKIWRKLRLIRDCTHKRNFSETLQLLIDYYKPELEKKLKKSL